jgi:predicted nucleic acid-binding protein
MRTYYCDSGVFCAYFSNEPGRADIVLGILKKARAGEVQIITSSFALVEVLKVAGHPPLKKDAEQKIVAFFKYKFIHFVDANRYICAQARHLIWSHPALKPKDAVHLASAI